MKTRPLAAARSFFLRTTVLTLLVLAGAATSYGDCLMDQPGDAENLLTDLLNGKPPKCAGTWYVQIDPAFHSWPMGSQNKPVVAAALGLYKSGPDANLDWHSTIPNPTPGKPPLMPVSNPTGYKISYVNWWIWYLASQVGEDPSTYLPTDTANPDPLMRFSPPPEGRALMYFKGTEEFSNIYDTANAVAAVAVRQWVYRYGNQIHDQRKVQYLKNLTRRFLRVHWALYGMAAGETPVWKYDLGNVPTSDGTPLSPRTPVLPPNKPAQDTQYNPNAPRTGSTYNYSGHFVALAGARSELAGHWGFDYRFQMFDRAIDQLGTFVQQVIKKPPPEIPLLDTLQSQWATLPSPPPTDETLYGLTADEKENIKVLITNCYYNVPNPATAPTKPTAICSGNTFASDFQSWLKRTFQPWLGNIHLATTYRILGANGWRASMMAENTNGNTTNVYAVYYKKGALDNGTHAQATFLFPWWDRDGGIPGECKYEPSTGRITAQHMIVQRPDRHNHDVLRTVHPAMTVYMDIPTEPPLIQLTLTPEGPPVFGSSAVAKSLTKVFTPYGTAFGNDEAWVNGNVPEGSVLQSANESWNWVMDDPFPYTEAGYVHLSSPVADIHQHFFTGATDSLPIAAGDMLYAYVYYETSNMPSEVMLQWFDGTWEHRAFWGANLIAWGDPGQGHRYMGELPAPGNWARLEVPASLVGLEGHTISGMAFTLYNGQAAWDEAGKHTLAEPVTNIAPSGVATQKHTYTASPAGGPASLAVDGNTNGNWFASSVTSTNYDYQPWWQVDLGDTYAIDSINVWNRSDCCAERLSDFYILVSDQQFASDSLTSVLSQPGVMGYYVQGQGGYPTIKTIQRSGHYVRVQLTGTNYLHLAEVEVFGRPTSSTSPPPPPPTGPPSSDVVWVEDSVPAGATNVSGGWSWVGSGPPPVSGSLAHQSALVSGGQQHFFSGATNRLTVNPGDKLMTYVYLDPQNPPSEIMVQWYDPAAMPNFEWEHRAYWGANLITQLGTDGQDSRRYMGALPPSGQWFRLEVPASQVGLEGHTISGMAFTQWDGRVTWDRSGKNAQSFIPPPPPGDTVWVEDSLPAGAIPYTDNDSWTWNSINPPPASGGLANQSSSNPGMHQHYFVGASNRLTVNAGDKMVVYVYLDPQDRPSEIMVQWHDSLNGWSHRAYWGSDQLAYFGTRYYMGGLPAAGQWIRLEVPASLVGLAGSTIDGLAFTLFDGRATWDHAGKRP